MSTKYTLHFINQSSQTFDFTCYQQDPNISNQNVFSLAWFAHSLSHSQSTSFSWTIDYRFVWGQTGVLIPGVQFVAAQSVPASLTQNNSVEFTSTGGALLFTNENNSSPAGTLTIRQSGSVPIQSAAVGINMQIQGPGAGPGTFVTQAQPNIDTPLTPHPSYWVAAGSNISPGQVLETRNMLNSAEVVFPPNIFEMYATLAASGSWQISTKPA